MSKKPAYQRILLKISGEALLGSEKFGIDPKAALMLAQEIIEIQKSHVEVAVVIGGGNILRGSQAKELTTSREKADQMGMLATALNGMTLVEALERQNCPAALCGAFSCGTFIPECNGAETAELLEGGVVVVFVGGTGLPYFTTDTAAALRACEIKADVLIKATKVDGVFDKDPIKHKGAKRLEKITYTDILSGKLDVMDATAVALCRENNIPIHILNIFKKGALRSAVKDRSGGSLVTSC